MSDKKRGTKLTPKHYAIFKAECRKWIERLGLTDWKIFYSFGHIENALAACDRDVEGRVARLSLNPFAENCAKHEVDVRLNAKHEVIHFRRYARHHWDAGLYPVVAPLLVRVRRCSV